MFSPKTLGPSEVKRECERKEARRAKVIFNKHKIRNMNVSLLVNISCFYDVNTECQRQINKE